MGGGGGSTYSGGGGGGQGPAVGGSGSGVDCMAVRFEAPVVSPDPAVTRAVAVGTICDVVREGTPPRLRLRVQATGAVLGAVTERWQTLVGCIAQGVRYEASVTQVSPPRVLIYPVA